MSYRVVFMGTPEFAVPSLETIHADGHAILVVTQPARPAGRGRSLKPSPVRAAAERLGIVVHERASLRSAEALAPLRDFAPDFVVVVAFGLILRQAVLDLPRYVPVNLHPSRLPQLRGVAPIPWTIWLGELETAVATMHMDRGVDTGGVLMSEPVTLDGRETTGGLTARLAQLGAPLVVRTLHAVAQQGLVATPQAASGATYAPRLEKAHGDLDLAHPAVEIDRQIRAVTPWPGARLWLGDLPLAVLEADVGACRVDAPAGEIVGIDETSIEVATAAGSLRLRVVKPAGKSAMSGAAFARGRHLNAGDRLRGVTGATELAFPQPVEEKLS